MDDPIATVRAIHFAAITLAAGVVFFQFVVSEPAFAQAGDELRPAIRKFRRRCLWLLWIGIAIAIGSAAAWLVLLAANITGAPAGEVWRNGGLWTVATQTRFGELSLARLVLAICVGFAVCISRKVLRVVSIAMAAAMLVSPAWSGHAGAAPGPSGQWRAIADAMHLLAVGAWIGGLAPLALLLAAVRAGKEPGWAAVTRTAISKFSWLGIACVAVLLATGIINTWYQVGSFNNLFETTYGRLVVLKIALFASMVALAATNRFFLTPQLAAVGAVRRLQRNCVAELILGLAAVWVAGVLGTMAPAIHAHQHPAYGPLPSNAAFIHIHGEQAMADVMIIPGRTGIARATIRLWNEDFASLPAQEVTLTLTAPLAASTPLFHVAFQDPDGAWVVDRVDLAQPGNWTVSVGAVLSPANRVVLTAPIVIEPK